MWEPGVPVVPQDPPRALFVPQALLAPQDLPKALFMPRNPPGLSLGPVSLHDSGLEELQAESQRISDETSHSIKALAAQNYYTECCEQAEAEFARNHIPLSELKERETTRASLFLRLCPHAITV